MGIFKRICLLVFGLSGLLALAAMGLSWFGPWTAAASSLITTYDYYYYALQALCVITGLGCLICLLRALFTRNHKVIEVSREGGDSITVTRDAVASQVINVVESSGNYRVRGVTVRAKKFGHVRVFARIQPLETVDVVAEGARLHDLLMAGIATIVGDNVDGVSIEFARADTYASSWDAQEEELATQPADAAPTVAETPVVAVSIEPAASDPDSTDITVPVGPRGAVADADQPAEEE